MERPCTRRPVHKDRSSYGGEEEEADVKEEGKRTKGDEVKPSSDRANRARFRRCLVQGVALHHTTEPVIVNAAEQHAPHALRVAGSLQALLQAQCS